MLYLGNIYLIGSISDYIAIKYDVSKFRASKIGMTTLLILCVMVPVGAMLTTRGMPPKFAIVVGSGAGLVLMSMASIAQHFFMFKLLYSLSFGISYGLSFYASIHEAWKFFPNHAGLASGLILSGVSAAGLIFDPLAARIVNPQSLTVDHPDYEN